MDYIQRIKQIKNEKKITNDKLSELTGIPLGTLSKILAGMNDSPKLSNMIAIADALGCPLDYIINGRSHSGNNFTLSEEEISFVEKFRGLDSCGKDIALFVVNREYARVNEAETPSPKLIINNNDVSNKKIISNPSVERAFKRRSIFLYDLPVSAGTGVYLDESTAERINIPDNDKTVIADFALRISGNSMEPKYCNGDILLVKKNDSPEIGELGIFILDGSGYFKKYGGDRLISLNPEYDDIMLDGYSDVICCGKVVGKLKRK